MFGYLFVAMILQCVIISLLSCITTYMQLCNQDYNWWWKSFVLGASGSLYIFFFTAGLMLQKIKMFKFNEFATGIIYLTIFIGCYVCTTGFMGVASSYKFIKILYATKKSE